MDNPKEKAQELMDKFNLPTGLMSQEIKQCAVICCDELIRVLLSVNGRPPNYQDENEFCSEYWKKVKTEIEKL